jgi:hypothetical protein
MEGAMPGGEPRRTLMDYDAELQQRGQAIFVYPNGRFRFLAEAPCSSMIARSTLGGEFVNL